MARENDIAVRKDSMTITNISDPNSLTGAPVHGSDGGKLGKVEAVYFDNDSNQPEWVSVKSGLFGSHVSIVPLSQGSWDGNALTVPFDKDAIQAAPHHDPDASTTHPSAPSGLATPPRIPGRPLPAQLQPGRQLPRRRQSAGGGSG